MKKYEMMSESIEYANRKLYRIRALANFDKITAGMLGGFIEKEANLSQEDGAWVGNNALVYGDANVADNAFVSGSAHISDNARVYDNASVFGDVRIFGDTFVFENALILDNVWVFDNAWIFGDSQVSGNIKLYRKTKICNSARISQGNHFLYLESPVLQGGCISFFRTKSDGIYVMHGTFIGNITQFVSVITTMQNKDAREVCLEAIKLTNSQIEK